MKNYQLIYNASAGNYDVKQWTKKELNNWESSGYRLQYGYFNEVGVYRSKKALNKAIDKLKGDDEFAVYENSASGEAFYTQENNLSGNWKGTKYHPASFVKSYKKEEDAIEHVNKLIKYYNN